MPHVRIEYSGNLGTSFSAQTFARRVHEHLVQEAGAELASCKTRLIELQYFVIGDGSERNAMIHVDMRILGGRTEAQKTALGEAVLSSLKAAIEDGDQFDFQLSVEVRELDRDHYRKVRL